LREILEILDVKEEMRKWVVVWSLKWHATHADLQRDLTHADV